MNQPATQRTRVMVVFGGRSSEHSISCATAGGVLGAIDRDRYEVIPVGITRDGAWVLEADDPERFQLNPESLPEIVDNGTRIMLPDTVNSREVFVDENGARRSLGVIDMAFPILHGPFGEDGTVQGMLDLVGLPYVGSSVFAASAGMDKHYTKLILKHAGIKVADGVTITERRWMHEPEQVRAELIDAVGFPMFVKPARAGSSVGVSKVHDASEIDEALRVAFLEDDHLLVEKAVIGREVEIAILESMPGERPRASVAGEIKLSGAEFYDFAAKYLNGPGVELECPAALTDAELAEMQELGIRAFEALGAAGLSRVDFFLTEDGFVINEVNTMPGFTPISMFPKCWRASGLSYPELITELLEVALAHDREQLARRERSLAAR